MCLKKRCYVDMSVEEDETNSIDFNYEISTEMKAQIAVASSVAAVVAS